MPEHTSGTTPGDRSLRTLVLDPDPAVADRHGEYVRSTPGFAPATLVHSVAAALSHLDLHRPDLLLLEFDLPGGGPQLCRDLAAHIPHGPDVIAVTAVRDLAAVRAATCSGALGYLLKPVPVRTFQAALRRYAGFRRRTPGPTCGRAPICQEDVDAALSLLRPEPGSASATSGTLQSVTAFLRSAPDPVSAHQVAESLGISRVTARRYLEELTVRRQGVRSQRYGGSGRPRHLYQWRPDQAGTDGIPQQK